MLTARSIRHLLILTILATLAAPVAEAAKTFIYALEGRPGSLDLAKDASNRTYRVSHLLCDPLINLSADGQSFTPGVAESWAVSPDGLEVTMRLRAGATFHDGTPITAAAVKDSFERQFRSGHPLYTREPRNTKEPLLAQLIDEIRVPDVQTFGLKLKYPGLHHLEQIPIVSPTALAALGKEFGRKPVCSGPFKYESWTDSAVTLTANDRYWAGRPKIDRVVFDIMTKSSEVPEKLRDGHLDFTPVIVDPATIEQLRNSPGVKLFAVPGLNVFYLGMYTERPPLNNPALRQALVHAIDTERMARILGRGTAEPARGPLSPAMMGWDPAVGQAGYRPEDARALLAKAGVGAGTLRLAFNAGIGFLAELAAAIRSALGEAGVTVDLVPKPDFQALLAAAKAREGDLFLYNWFISTPHPDRLLMPLFHSKSIGTSNLTHYRNPQVDRQLDEAVRLPTGPVQQKLYSEIQQAIVRDAPMVFLFHWTRMAAYRDRVKGLTLKLDSTPADKLLGVTLAD